MSKEDKELLLQDLCARLPYGLYVQDEYGDIVYISYNDVHFANYFDSVLNGTIKPYLYPLSSMSDELWDKEFMGCGITEFTRDSFKYGCETLAFNNSNPNLSRTVRFINQLIKNYFDIYGLIPKGLAIDATNKL